MDLERQVVLSLDHARDAVAAYATEDVRVTQIPVSERKMTSSEFRPLKTGDCTHTFFAGGRAAVPFSHIERFMDYYAIDLVVQSSDNQRRLLNHLVERLQTSGFPLFVDFDLKCTVPIEDVEGLHRDYWRLVQQQVRRFYPHWGSEVDGTMIVCERVPLYSQGVTKYGAHLHFPYITVNSEQAFTIRESIIAAFRNYYQERVEPENEWCDVFDGSIYGNGGMRPIGSYKLTKCAAGDEGEVGNRKRHTQLDSEGRPVTYWPALAINSEGEPHPELQQLIDRAFPSVDGRRSPAQTFGLARLHQAAKVEDGELLEMVRSVLALVRLTQVRVAREPSKDYCVYDGAPRPHSRVRRNPSTGRTEMTYTCSSKQIERSGQHHPVTFRRTELLERVEGYLRRLARADGSPIWPRIQVADVRLSISTHRKVTTASLLVIVRGEGSHYCLNRAGRNPMKRGGDHSSNHIFFFLSHEPPYIHQRCHNKCSTLDCRYSSPVCPAMYCRHFDSGSVGCVYLTRPSPELLDLIQRQLESAVSQGGGAKRQKR